MNCIAHATVRLTRAEGLAEVLDAAYDAFEDILAVLRRHQQADEGSFAAFVFAACPAAEAPGLPRRSTIAAARLARKAEEQPARTRGCRGRRLCSRRAERSTGKPTRRL